MSKRINRNDIDTFHDYGLHLPTRTIAMETPFSDEGDEHGVGYSMIQRVVKNLRLLDHASSEPITLLLNTGGGDIEQGMGIYDAIKACRSTITGLVIGQASSMGSVILQACDERVGSPWCSVMYHAGTMDGAPGYPFREGKRAVDYEFRYGELIDEMMWRRVQEKKPSLSFSKFKVECDRGIYLLAKEAVEWGLLDRIEEVHE